MLDVNSYFNGEVKSIQFQGESLPTTVGVMSPGQYTFTTSKKEEMTVVAGQIKVRLPGEEDWQSYAPGASFTIPAGEKFDALIEGTPCAYLCTYE